MRMMGWVAVAAMTMAAPALADEACKVPMTLRPVIATHTVPPYPEMSVMTQEEGTTLLVVHIGADGVPIDVKTEQSSGSLRLDEAAQDYVKTTWRWQPPTVNCKPIDVSTRVSIKWDLKDAPDQGPQPPRIEAARSDYPAGALAKHEQGDTLVVLMIPAQGNAMNAQVINSSGFPDLDAKALEIAKTHQQRTPARMNGTAVNTTVYVNIVWNLDKAAGASH